MPRQRNLIQSERSSRVARTSVGRTSRSAPDLQVRLLPSSAGSRGAWLLLAALLVSLTAYAAKTPESVWPARWREHTRVKLENVAPPAGGAWSDGQGDLVERATYQGPAGKFTGTAWRLRDSTAALSFYDGLRPENAVPLRGAETTATTPGAEYIAYKNYVFQFEGWRPLDKELEALYAQLPQVRSLGGLPSLIYYLPAASRTRNSERYVFGLATLAAYAPQVPSALAGFEEGAEAALARYDTPHGNVTLLIFEYATPQAARLRLPAFQHQSGWQMKRSGPLVAVVVGADASSAQALLDGIEWNVAFTWNDSAKRTQPPNVAAMLLGAFALTGTLLGATLLGGIIFAALGVWIRRRGLKEGEPDTGMTWLNLHD
jgi:hypothetical protein